MINNNSDSGPIIENTIVLTESHIIRRKKSKLPPPSCAICAEYYNKSSRSLIQCEYCPFESCRACCERFLLLENDPTCMDRTCNRQWTHEFIANNFTKKFINTDLKTHREKTLFDKQRALLPSTQPLVENILQREEFQKRIHLASIVVSDARHNMNRIQTEYYRFINSVPTSQDRSAFVRACPSSECRGFLSSQWKCGICALWTCPTCHEIRGIDRNTEHTCNPDNVATAKLLNSDTKPCPKCGEGIFKIDGCDQLWCTQCHTAFSWRSGRIEHVIHNPHYYEWMRRNGTMERNPADIPCGQEINHRTGIVIKTQFIEIERKNKENAANLTSLRQTMIEVTRRIVHLRYGALPRFQYDSDKVTEQLRIQYMRNFISEDYFKIMLQKEFKKNNKYREIREVVQLLIATMTDIIYRFIKEINNREWKYNLDRKDEVFQIIQYTDECFLKISKTYSSIPLSYATL